ncbi:cytochrome C oxidase subunit IV family protein [bacterium]|nr:cytochrome C oxidase subunit IV family protein [bacterium]
MSTQNNKAHEEFHPHVLPISAYLGVFSALIFFTIITVVVAAIDLGPFNMVVAMLIAGTKALLVGLIFMHLLFDRKLYLMLFLVGMITLTIFIVITMFDTERRGDIFPEVGKPIKVESEHYQAPIEELRAKHGGHSEHGAEEGHGEAESHGDNAGTMDADDHGEEEHESAGIDTGHEKQNSSNGGH